jgi:hypothetical protein
MNTHISSDSSSSTVKPFDRLDIALKIRQSRGKRPNRMLEDLLEWLSKELVLSAVPRDPEQKAAVALAKELLDDTAKRCRRCGIIFWQSPHTCRWVSMKKLSNGDETLIRSLKAVLEQKLPEGTRLIELRIPLGQDREVTLRNIDADEVQSEAGAE